MIERCKICSQVYGMRSPIGSTEEIEGYCVCCVKCTAKELESRYLQKEGAFTPSQEIESPLASEPVPENTHQQDFTMG